MIGSQFLRMAERAFAKALRMERLGYPETASRWLELALFYERREPLMKYREYTYTGKWADGSLHTDTVYVAHPVSQGCDTCGWTTSADQPHTCDGALRTLTMPRTDDRIVWDVQDYPNKHLAHPMDRQWAAQWLRIRRLAGRESVPMPIHGQNELRLTEGWIIRKTTEYVPNMPVDAYAEPGKVVLHGDGMSGYGYKSGETAEGSAYQEMRLDAGSYDDFHEHTECDEHGSDYSGLADGETCRECEKVQDCQDGNCECITRLEQCSICDRDLGGGDTVWLCLDGGDTICPDHIVHDERPDSLFEKVGGVRGAMLPAFAWPGGHCIVYLDRSNSALCAECASKVDTSDPATQADVDEEMNCADCDHAQSLHSDNPDGVSCEYGHDGPDADEVWHPCNCTQYSPPLCGDCNKPIDPALRAKEKAPVAIASFSDGTEDHPW